MKYLNNILFFVFLNFIVFSEAQQLNLKIVGESAPETKVIDSISYKKGFSNLNLLNSEIDSLELKLQFAGYFDIIREQLNKTSDSTYKTKLRLGSKIDTIYIYTQKEALLQDALKGYGFNKSASDNRAYYKIAIEKLPKFIQTISQQLISEGNPFGKIQLENIERLSEKTVSAELNLVKGKKRTIDKFIIKGYEKFPKSYLTHFLKIRKKNVFDLDLVKQKVNTLSNLTFASSTKPPEILFTKDSTILYLYLAKQQANSFDGFLGFGTNEETNRLEFDGYLNLLLVNNLNFGETFYLSYKSDEIDQQTFNTKLQLPYLFKSPLGIEASLNIFKKDSSFTTTNQELQLFYPVTQKLTVFGGIDSRQSNSLLSETVQISTVEDYSSLFYKLKADFTVLQSENLLFRRKTGIALELGLGNRDVASIKTSQELFGVDAFNIFNLNQKNSLFFRVTAKGLLSDDFFENELYRFGGITSIRGFEENSLVASLYAVLNTEYRYQLSQSIYVHSIFDAGYLQNDLNAINEKLFGFGLGFGILTKAGLLKFNYANGKFEGQKFRFSDSKIHLSLSATF